MYVRTQLGYLAQLFRVTTVRSAHFELHTQMQPYSLNIVNGSHRLSCGVDHPISRLSLFVHGARVGLDKKRDSIRSLNRRAASPRKSIVHTCTHTATYMMGNMGQAGRV